MAVDVLLGLQWGDEGKGKIVDAFAPKYDIVARFQGGPNAGHTIIFNGQKVVLHQIPSGIFHPHATCIIGNGVVLDPVTLRREIVTLEQLGYEVRSKMLISQRAHLILPTHKLLDAASEKSKGDQKIGSTLRGIGPTYMDKTGRNGLRVGDIANGTFEAKYKALREKHIGLLANYNFEYDLSATESEFLDAVDFLRRLKLMNTEIFLHDALADGKSVLAEGAQGSLLDIEFGSYPFVTSSNTLTAGACIGLGIAPRHIDKVYGIIKAYCTRVGSGPFPTELHDDMGERIRQAGGEFGATTGRPRRCGWLDLPLVRYACNLNGVTDIIMTKSDVLSELETIQVCHAYDVDGEITQAIPYDLTEVSQPRYTAFDGWLTDLTGIRDKADVPKQLMDYTKHIEAYLKTPIAYLSVGPDRTQTLVM